MPNPDSIAHGAQLLAQADLAGAEKIARDHLAVGENADALHLLALVRIHQERFDEAISLLRRSLQARPAHAHVLLNLGKVLALLKRPGEAAGILAKAVEADATLGDAWYELGEVKQTLGDLEGAEHDFRTVLELAPAHPFAQLSLGVTIKDDGRPAEAEPLLADGFARAEDPRLKTAFLYQLAFAQYDQGKKKEALANFAEVKRRDPARASVDFSRADLLMELGRPDEALALLEEVLSREPDNSDAHKAYNNMLYQLGRDEQFLKSYDRAAPSASLQLGKAGFLLQVERSEEAYETYAAILRHDPKDLSAEIGAAISLNRLGRHDEAFVLLEAARGRFPLSVPVLQQLASTALQARDAKKAVSVAEEACHLAPHDHYGLALLGLAWRMAGDERDETLNGYDELVRIFDLEPPPGFSNMAAFNAALNQTLSGLHHATREPAAQSLRGGSQTAGRLFSSRVELVDLLKTRIEDAVGAYVAALKPDSGHPLRGRRRQGFRFAGSWSSRLSNCGFHINHIHPEGWISSCYYVGVPEAVKDETAKQGWIKFGEPSFPTGLAARRAIQPVPGRLVLFPSYMWHGTIPFHDAQPRTTVAFDVVPR